MPRTLHSVGRTCGSLHLSTLFICVGNRQVGAENQQFHWQVQHDQQDIDICGCMQPPCADRDGSSFSSRGRRVLEWCGGGDVGCNRCVHRYPTVDAVALYYSDATHAPVGTHDPNSHPKGDYQCWVVIQLSLMLLIKDIHGRCLVYSGWQFTAD